MRDKYSFSLRQLDSTSLIVCPIRDSGGRTLKFSEMGRLPPTQDEEGEERREKREWTDNGGVALSFNSYLNRRTFMRW